MEDSLIMVGVKVIGLVDSFEVKVFLEFVML